MAIRLSWYTNWMSNTNTKAKGPGYLDLHHRLDDMVCRLAADFKAGKILVWPVVSKARVHKVWDAFIKDGYVRDEEALEKIFMTMRDSVVRLEVATIVAEHTGISPDSILSEYLEPKQYEAFTDWLVDFGGASRLSDYGLGPLQDAIALAFEAKNPAERLKYLDRALNVVHARGDLALLFIEGGRQTVLAVTVESQEEPDFEESPQFR